MPLVVLGRNNIAALIVSTGSMRPWSSTGAYFIVGNSTAAHATNQTWMQGASSTMAPMDAGYPTRSVNVCTFRATFSTAQANFAWQEWGITNTTSTGDANQSLLNRKQEDPSLGTKTSAQSWQITADITFTT